MDLTTSMIVQKFAAKGGPEFFFIVNFQVNLVFSLIFNLFILVYMSVQSTYKTN